MLFTTTLILNVLLASAVVAIPHRGHVARAAHRHLGVRSRFNHRDETAASSDPPIEYGPNWSGAVWDVYNDTFTSIVGTFKVPTASGKDWSGGAIWVGIDGHLEQCGSGLLQTGIDFTMVNGQAQYDAWYEWYPNNSYGFDETISISAGDTIKLTIKAFSTTSGFAMVENLSNGQNGTKKVHSTYPLCQHSAEWIVEDYESSMGGPWAPFADFSPVTITGAKAMTAANKTYTPLGADICGVEQNDQILTSVSINGSSLTVHRL